MGERRFFTGLDLGQAHDFSTIAVLERVVVKGEWDGVAFDYRKHGRLRLRHLERIPLGTPYQEVVRRTRQVTGSGEIQGACELVVDATGVGRPVVDLLRAASLTCSLVPAVITGGMSESYANGFRYIPKTNLITGLQIALQRGDLQIAGGMADAPALVEEMTEMRVRITGPGHEQVGAWRDGEHDDLVFAVALACWGARRAYPGDVRGG